MQTRMRGSMAVGTVLLLAAGAGGWYWWSRPSEVASPLTTAMVTRGNVVQTVSATGTVQAVTTVQVGTQVSGSIKALYADFNSRVRTGQVIAELEPSLFQSQVEQARASLLRLQSEVDRARVQADDGDAKLRRAEALATQQLLAATDLDTARATAASAAAAVKSAEAQVVQAQASLTQAQVNLDYTVIRAPIDGVVISRNVDVGQTVAASMQAPTLFVIAKDLAEMQVNASIDEADIGRIRAGQDVSFRVDAFPQQSFSGEVVQVRLSPVVEQNVVSYVTVIHVPNRDLLLKPGMTASVAVDVARADDVLRVPTSALRFKPSADVLARFGEGAASGADSGGAQQAVDRNASTASDVRLARADRSPIQPASSSARATTGAHVWVFDGTAIHEVSVAAGVSDGTSTEVDGDLGEGETVVINAATSATSASASASGAAPSSPLIPRVSGRGGAGTGRQGAATGGRP